jgi:hypothetical protein
MSDETNRSDIKVTDKRHFDRTGQRRSDESMLPENPPETGAVPGPAASAGSGGVSPGGPARGEGFEARQGTRAPADLSEVAAGLSSSFSLLVARLAQETEIYLGLVPFPGKPGPEPDLGAARAMIDMLSMLEDKTRGNLDPEESRLLSELLYTYRLEFVRVSGGGTTGT